jgi:hypothetical protein
MSDNNSQSGSKAILKEMYTKKKRRLFAQGGIVSDEPRDTVEPDKNTSTSLQDNEPIYDPQTHAGMSYSPTPSAPQQAMLNTMFGEAPKAEAFADPRQQEAGLMGTGAIDPTNAAAFAAGPVARGVGALAEDVGRVAGNNIGAIGNVEQLMAERRAAELANATGDNFVASGRNMWTDNSGGAAQSAMQKMFGGNVPTNLSSDALRAAMRKANLNLSESTAAGNILNKLVRKKLAKGGGINDNAMSDYLMGGAQQLMPRATGPDYADPAEQTLERQRTYRRKLLPGEDTQPTLTGESLASPPSQALQEPEIAPEDFIAPAIASKVAPAITRGASALGKSVARVAGNEAGTLSIGKKAAEQPIRLVHYSDVPNIEVVDPEFMGTGVRGRAELNKPSIPHQSYYIADTPPEDLVLQQKAMNSSGKPYKYKTELPADSIYDYAKDPENILPKANGIDEAREMIKAAGYKGVMNSNDTSGHKIVQVFDKLKVSPAAPEGLEQLDRPHFLFTSENPMQARPGTRNVDRDTILQELQKKGWDAEATSGKYGIKEKSIIVNNVSPEQAEELHKIAAELGQQSGIYSNGINHEMRYYAGDNAGESAYGKGTQYHGESIPDDDYTTLSNGQSFAHNFDFKNLKKSGYLNKVLQVSTPPSNQLIRHDVTGAPSFSQAEINSLNAAKKAGFNTNKVYYHGTPKGKFSEFDPSLTNRDYHGEIAGYFSEDPGLAKSFATNKGYFHNGEEKAADPFINRVFLKANNTFDFNNNDHLIAMHDQLKKLVPENKANEYLNAVLKEKKETPDSVWRSLEESPVVKAIKKAGFDSMNTTELGRPNIAVFNPNQIRYTNAKFNPKKLHLGELSAGVAGAIGAGAAGKDQYASGGRVSTAGNPKLQQAYMAEGGDPTDYISNTLSNNTQLSGIPAGQVPVVNPEGKIVAIPQHQLQDALGMGYTQAAPEQVQTHIREQRYGSIGQQALTGLEGAGEAATFGGSTGLETGLGLSTPEDIQARRETNPGTHMLGQMAGLGASTLIPGVGEANVLEHAGQAAVALLPKATTTAARIGSSAVKAAVEGALFNAGDEVSKTFAKDPNQTAETALVDTGLGALFGGATGATFASVPALWKATFGGKTGGTLRAIGNKLGGGAVTDDAMNNAIQASGLDIPAEVRTALSNDPALRSMFKTLEESDTTSSGRELQQTYNNFRKQIGDHIAQSMGKTPEEAASLAGELSQAAYGRKLGQTLAKEYGERLSPLTKEFDDLISKYGNTEFTPDKFEEEIHYKPTGTQRTRVGAEGMGGLGVEPMMAEVPTYETTKGANKLVQPGTASQIADEIDTLAQTEQWTNSPSSEIMREVNRAISEIKNIKDLKGLSNYGTRIGENTASTLPFGQQTPVSRAGMLMKNVLREHEAEIALQRLGEEAPELIGRFQEARAGYRDLAKLKDALDYRLSTHGSVNGFGKAVNKMAAMDGETLIRRLSGEKDADLLEFLQQHFPESANVLKEYHRDKLLSKAAAAAKGEENINVSKLRKDLAGMAPELRKFAIDDASGQKIDAMGSIIDHLNAVPHNFSNTARGIDKLMQHVPGGAVAAATLLTGHNPVAALVYGGLARTIGKNAPDAIRLATLKFLGTNKPLDSTAFYRAVNYAQSYINGYKQIQSAGKNLFKQGAEIVIPNHMIPKAEQRNKLDKQLKAVQANPEVLLESSGNTGHYLPEHAQALGHTAVEASNYLNSLRPGDTQLSPLDRKLPPDSSKVARYNRALDTAVSPLITYDRISKGKLTPTDVVDLKNLYPSLFNKIQQDLHEFLIETNAKGKPIPYKIRQGLSLLLTQPLDSTLTGASIAAAQPQPTPSTSQQEAQQPGMKGTKHATNALNKLPNQYRTASESRQERASKV